MQMPKHTIELMLGTQLVIVQTLLKLKSLPDVEREKLNAALVLLEEEINAYKLGEEMASKLLVAALMKKMGF